MMHLVLFCVSLKPIRENLSKKDKNCKMMVEISWVTYSALDESIKSNFQGPN